MVNTSKKSLYKSTDYRIFTGVSAGIADYLDASPGLIRFLFILFTFASGVGFILYLTLSLILPTEQEIKEQEDLEFYYNVTKGIPMPEPVVDETQDILAKSYSINNIIGLFIIAIGSAVLEFEIIPWNMVSGVWRIPAIIIVIGFGFILKSITRKKTIV